METSRPIAPETARAGIHTSLGTDNVGRLVSRSTLSLELKRYDKLSGFEYIDFVFYFSSGFIFQVRLSLHPIPKYKHF